MGSDRPPVTADRVFYSAAASFAELVAKIPAGAWDGPGLGEWDLRALVGHTSRSLTTVSAYLGTTARREDLRDPQEYYVFARQFATQAGGAAVLERGRQAGRDLGPDPVAAVEALAAQVRRDLDGADDRLIEVIGGQGIRLSNYLPTRTFELAVHGLDIARAVGLDHALPRDVLAAAVRLAADTAVTLGDGETLLMALTGRAPLPASFSVV
ncbi:maleylpyruvate isomerase N-terminal domain-containing protein [Mycobacterium manitobense]|uniref:Maleylpyruvate isomerase N-terminal domain-containing protein n=2 Tax=Mycolicibacterium TaxID=1866885 RepID=A0A9X2YR78_9MYCO|nr:maleylpyruvate isomerase N-terminal domain-containing protein [[Mycobacterium] manitobense]